LVSGNSLHWISQCTPGYEVKIFLLVCICCKQFTICDWDCYKLSFIFVFVRLLFRYVKVNLMTLYFQKTNQTVSSVFDKTAKRRPDKICIRFEDEKWSFSQVKVFYTQNMVLKYCLLFSVYSFCRFVDSRIQL